MYLRLIEDKLQKKIKICSKFDIDKYEGSPTCLPESIIY